MQAMMNRRTVLGAAGAALALTRLGGPARGAAPAERRLVAAPAKWPLVGPPHPDTDVWAYGGQVPGPEIRLRQGERLKAVLDNRLAQETTIHWHGIRLPHAMDGVPHLTQAPVKPGGTFTYDFVCPDAGTFWYHPHARSFEQVGRGLYGALIVEEAEPPAVDRDLVWVLDDWRLLANASLAEDFGNFMDMSHAGQVGNTVTINGRLPDRFGVRAGERIRLRLINVANARIFSPAFAGHQPTVIALDGQPVEPHAAEEGRVTLGPGMRADLILDMTGKPGETFSVVDGFYRQQSYKLVDLAYGPEAPPRRPPLGLVRLPANPLPEPDAEGARRHEVALGGGMMGGMMAATVDGKRVDMRALMQQGLAWAINGVAAQGHHMEPMLTLKRGQSHVLAIRNDTAWHHAMHPHGHSFRVLARDGQPTRRREWQDTILLAPREQADIAFVADNPGDWMFHCHMLEHQDGGMMGIIRVA
jgi:FtsP/CotA-like multicopper oxidase with cupredoxin domain